MKKLLGAVARGCVAAALPCTALAADPLVADLEQRLTRGGAESVNEYLNEPPGAASMSRLNRQTAKCELQAVSLAVRLARGVAPAPVVQAHEEALRAATGRCARFVLALVSSAEVPRVCASQPFWGAAQTARELRRRIADIDADTLLRGTEQGQACRAAYLYELRNTRVTLRAVKAGAGVPEGRHPFVAVDQ